MRNNLNVTLDVCSNSTKSIIVVTVLGWWPNLHKSFKFLKNHKPFFNNEFESCKVSTNEPNNTTISFDKTATARTINLRINSLQTESKAGNHSRESGDRKSRVRTAKFGIENG